MTRDHCMSLVVGFEMDDLSYFEPVLLENLDLSFVDLYRLLRDIDASGLHGEHDPAISL